jgi:outer membrane protein assembly factor BamC
MHTTHLPRKATTACLLLCTTFLGTLSGCSVVRSWFPDKEKDYQFAKETSPLVIPPDLIAKTKNTDLTAISQKSRPTPSQTQDKNAAPTIDSIKTDDAEISIDRRDIQVNLSHDQPVALHLNVPITRAWRIIGKALSRNNIEITRRIQEIGEINIQLATKTPAEHAFLDEAFAFLNPFESQELHYILKFSEMNGETSVIVVNSDSKPLIDGSDSTLLETLLKTIKADLGMTPHN